jgi:NifU-like protein involved in Fe-S cluster formation
MSLESFIKIARYLDISADYLLMDSVKGDSKNKAEKQRREFENIFKGKTPQQTDYLLNLFKVLSENLDRIKP